MTQAITTTTPASGALITAGMTREQIDLIKRTVAKGATDDELKMFLHVCETRRVDPFSKMVYLVPRYNSQTRQEEKALQSSIDYFRLVADRSGVYEGQAGPQWCGEDGVWKDVWLSRDAPAAARVGVWRKNFREPIWGTALWSNYVQTKKDGSATKFWNDMGPLMLAKCAESLALRRAFPEDLSGIYTSDEMAQAENVTPLLANPATGEAAPVTAKPPTKPATRTVDAKPVEPQPERDVQSEAIRLFKDCVPDHPGVLVPASIHHDWDKWKTQISVRGGGMSALSGMTWETASQGSVDGRRSRSLRWIVEDAVMEKVMAQEALTPFHLKGAWTLHVMLQRQASEEEQMQHAAHEEPVDDDYIVFGGQQE